MRDDRRLECNDRTTRVQHVGHARVHPDGVRSRVAGHDRYATGVDRHRPSVAKIHSMTTVEYSPPRQRLSWTRRVVGAVVCLTGLIALVLFALDRVTRDSVFLRSHFENYLTGLGTIIVIGVVALIVLTPVRNSAIQGRRMMVRFLLLALAALLFVGAGLTHGFDFFVYQPTIVASSPDGSRHVALVKIGTYKELQVFSGSGLGARITGSLGAPCEFF